jgi:hypothetical protein
MNKWVRLNSEARITFKVSKTDALQACAVEARI